MELFRRSSFLLWTALAAASATGLFFWSERRRGRLAAAFASAQILPRLFRQEALRHRLAKYVLRAAALALFLLALAGPQWGIELVTSQAKGAQAVIAIDTSLSMLSEDIKPSRMEAAKNELAQLIDSLGGQRLGLIAFAGEAQIQCPLTTDSEAVKSFLRRVSAGMISPPGTAIGKAIDLGASMLRRYPGQKALVLLTDGEDHAGRTLESARAAAEGGVRIYIIGIGTPDGAPIPLKDPEGRVTGYKKDSKGQTVITRLVEPGLIQIAAAASGSYYRATGTETEAGEISGQILELEKSATEGAGVNRYQDRYRIPLATGFLLLLIELVLPEAKLRGHPGASARKAARQAAPLAILVLFSLGWSWPESLGLWKGNSRYQKGEYGEALQEYQDAAERHPEDPRPVFDSGAALYKMEQYDQAGKAFEGLADPKKDPALAAKSLYNMGNSLYRRQQFKEAAQAFKGCLLLDPADEDCRFNLVMALKPPRESKNKSQNQDKKDQPQNQDKDKQQPPPSQPRPESSQGGLSREDAERILSAVKEKEKAASKSLQMTPKGKAKPGSPEEDW